MANKKRPMMLDLATIIAAGIDPKTGLPIKAVDTNGDAVGLQKQMLKLFSVIDEQDAINRYTWFNLPHGLNGHMIEKILYHKGKGTFFYMKESKTFFFLPYALKGSIDVYGRYTGITPVPLGSTKDENGKVKPWITGLTRKPVYDVLLDEPTLEDMEEKCVLLTDYNSVLPNDETDISRATMNLPLLNIMSNIIPYMNTALSNSTGVLGVRVNGEEDSAEVMAANSSVRYAALNGQRYIPIAGKVDFQELTSGSALKSADFMQALESLDNFRLSLYGVENGGLFQKKAHMLQEEQNLANNNVGLVMQDGLALRQRFCNIVNSIWPIGIWCEVSETVSGLDKNMDGEISDEQDGQQPIDMIDEGGLEDAD